MIHTLEQVVNISCESSIGLTPAALSELGNNEDLLTSIRRQALQILERAHIGDEPRLRLLKSHALTVYELQILERAC